MSRLQPVVDMFRGIENPEDIFAEIMDVLDDMEVVPNPGDYYTFIYKAKTPNITYDEFPLIACIEVKQWGFVGFNYHWGKLRNYTWGECLSQLYVIKSNELEDARSLSYARFRESS